MPAFPDLRLQTQRLQIRPLVAGDLVRVQEAGEDPVTQTWFPLPRPYTSSHAEAWMFDRAPALQASGVGLVRAIELDGDLAGTIDFKRTEWAAGVTEIGYQTCPWARSRGVMTEALQAVTAWALTEAGLHRVELRIATGNVASRRVAAKARFQLEGIARSAGYVHAGRVDLAIYSQTRQDLWARRDLLDVAAPGTPQ